MTHPMYVHVSLLNRLRATYLGPIIACDAPLYMQAPAESAVFAWVRGCDCTSRPNECVLVALNMDVTGGGARVDLDTGMDKPVTSADMNRLGSVEKLIALPFLLQLGSLRKVKLLPKSCTDPHKFNKTIDNMLECT